MQGQQTHTISAETHQHAGGQQMADPTFNRAFRIALYRIFRALARPILRYGLPARDAVDLLKKALVDVAREDYGLNGRPTNKARVAVLTGLTRSNVAQLIDQPAPFQGDTDSASHHPLNRVVSRWLREMPFCDEHGPRVLPEQGSADSFAELATSVGGDIAWQTLQRELLRNHIIDVTDGQVKLLRHAFLTLDDDLSTIAFLGEDAAALLHTIDHNLQAPANQKHFERKVVFRRLSPTGLSKLQTLAATDGQRWLEQLDSELSQYDMPLIDTDPAERISGLGIYVFDQPLPLGKQADDDSDRNDHN